MRVKSWYIVFFPKLYIIFNFFQNLSSGTITFTSKSKIGIVLIGNFCVINT